MASLNSGGWNPTGHLVQHLSKKARLSPHQINLLTAAGRRTKAYQAGTEIVSMGRPLTEPMLLMSGWANRQRLLSNGRCQILSILLPGDILGFDPDQFPIELESLVAVNNVKLISVASVTEAVACDARAHACLTQSIIASQNETQRRVLNSLVRIGAKTALERAADLFVELYERCKAIGFVQGLSFHMPLTQQMLANLIGISVVHANRTMAQLRMHRVFELVCGRATILDLVDLNRLADIAEDTSPGHRHWRSDKK